MVFKPFRPPLIRNRPAQSNPADDAGDEQAHPAKRRRVSTDEDDPELEDDIKKPQQAGRPETLKPQLASRRPLTQVKNLRADVAEDSSNNNDHDGDNNAAKTDNTCDGVEGYYNVLWFVSTAAYAPPFISPCLPALRFIISKRKLTIPTLTRPGASSPPRSTRPGTGMGSSPYGTATRICRISPAAIWAG